MNALLVWLVSGVVGVGAAASAERPPVPDARPLLLAALRGADGSANGVLSGDLAEAIGQRFGTTAPIHIDVTTIHRYVQPGCARLNVVFRQDDVRLPGAAGPQRQTIAFGIDYCLDGVRRRRWRSSDEGVPPVVHGPADCCGHARLRAVARGTPCLLVRPMARLAFLRRPGATTGYP